MSVEVVVVALIAVVVGSLLKSISGVGLPLVTIPAVSYVADVETAVAVTAVPNLALNLGLAWRERSAWADTRHLGRLIAACLVGGGLGTWVLVSVPGEPLIALLAVVVVIYAVTFISAPQFQVRPERAGPVAPVVGLTAGGLQGAIGISAPVIVPWIHAYRLSRSAHILSVTALFSAAGASQVPVLALSGGLDERWPVALAACIPALATIPIGSRLRDALSSEGFDRAVVAVLVCSVLGLAVRTFV